MASNVRHYKGSQITQDVIEQLKDLAKTRYSEEIYENYFAIFSSPQAYEEIHETKLEFENIVLGTDWVICYNTARRELVITDWIARKIPARVVSQSLEMYQAFKNILLNTETKRIKGFLRHDTSYQFYQLLLRKDYITVEDDVPLIDMCSDDEALITSQFVKPAQSFTDALQNGQIPKEYQQFVFHEVVFQPSKQFKKLR